MVRERVPKPSDLLKRRRKINGNFEFFWKFSWITRKNLFNKSIKNKVRLIGYWKTLIIPKEIKKERFYPFSIGSSGSFDILYTSIITPFSKIFGSGDLPQSPFGRPCIFSVSGALILSLPMSLLGPLGGQKIIYLYLKMWFRKYMLKLENLN